jgi:hypothetical protein
VPKSVRIFMFKPPKTSPWRRLSSIPSKILIQHKRWSCGYPYHIISLSDFLRQFLVSLGH